MINNLLNILYHLDIKIEVQNKKTKLIYKNGSISEEIKNQIKQHKKELLQRIKENEEALSIGFLVYNQGQLYEYRYGAGAYLYIERHSDLLADAWRANYRIGEDKPYKTIVIAKNVKFEQAYMKSKGFIEWIASKQKRGGKKYA